ncbi:hypothetical protein NM208_g8059 [Fusarium decemcellulare]|uniref:Uncharacterized protein n=1 Tax=Fusarium decemcellulare TaxID=57161 RepID=A0ACC1S6W0_9HYPO|nr:hypothetical protein NM208_g8059 [Fusarium decemcellulare]
MAPTKLSNDPEYANVLPADFLHGYASAAYQVEGAVSEGGRGPCSWDERLKGCPEDGADACRSYQLWEEDIKLLKQYGSNSYRFSISWSRVKPLGGENDPVNEEGVSYYNKLIDGLVAAGIEPTITLHHYDTPLELDVIYGGFAARDSGQLVRDFVSYARLCFERFGDRVKRWLTINEPWIYIAHTKAGLIQNFTNEDMFCMGYNCILTHASVAHLYRSEFQQKQLGKIGIALNYEWVEPIDDSQYAAQAAALSRDRCLGWFAKPIFLGTQTTAWDEYGEEFRRFTAEQLKFIHGSADFFSMNSYGTTWALGEPLTPENDMGSWHTTEGIAKTVEKDGKLIGFRGENGHPHIVPWGFKNLLVHCWEEYAKHSDMPIIVYENGFPVEDEQHKPINEIIDDKPRQRFFNEYIGALCEAVKHHGVRMGGYHCWSLLDNLEWDCGYGPRFGLTYVDKANGFKRIPKDSAKVVKEIWEHWNQTTSARAPLLAAIITTPLLSRRMRRNSNSTIFNVGSSPDSLPQGDQSETHPHRPRRTRVPLSCQECSRRKIRCDKKVPCLPCLERGEGSLCHRRANVSHRARLQQDTTRPTVQSFGDVETELKDLRARLARVEAALNAQNSARARHSDEETEETLTDFKENGLAGAMEEAALGIGENQRRQGASLEAYDTTPSNSQTKYRWFISLPFSECLCRLPTRSQSKILVDSYLDYLNWMNSCLHKPTFLREHDEFWDLYDQDRPCDGTYLSLLFAVLSMAAYFLGEEEANQAGLEMVELEKLGRLWFDCSLATLFRCEGFIKPSLTGCQVILTLNYSFHLSGNTAVHVTLSNLAVAFARTLNLHLLGNEKSASGDESLRKEIGRRVWWRIVETEWFLLPYHRFTTIAPHQFDTALPELTDDGQLASSSNNTHSLSFLLACCRSSRLLYDLYGTLEQKQFPSYEAVLGASTKLDQIINDLPHDLQPFRDIEPGAQSGSRPGNQYLRRFLGMLLSYRSYLIHRAYFAKSLRDQTYTESKIACVRAAGAILTFSDNGLPSTFYRLWNTTLWLVSAGIIFSLDLIYAASNKKILPDAVARRRRLHGLVDLLQTQGDKSGIGARGAKLIGHLCTIERDISAGKIRAVTFTPQDINVFVRNDPAEDALEAEATSSQSIHQASSSYQTLPMDALAAGAFDDSIFLPSAWGDYSEMEISGSSERYVETFGPNEQGNQLFDVFDDWALRFSGS